MNTLVEREIDENSLVVDLVRDAQDGDRKAFGELVTRYESAVFAAALRRLRNHAEAQELSQEVFVQALQKLHQLREPAAFPGWLMSITHRMAINRALRRGPIVTAEGDTLESGAREQSTPLGEVLARERRQQVRAGLKRLRSLDRETLVAFYVKGRSLAEMSDEFDSPLGTIKRRLHVARKRLAKELAELAPA